MLKKVRDICFSSRLAFVVSAFIFIILLASTIISSRISSDAVIKETMIRNEEILTHIMEKVESGMDEMDAMWVSFLRTNINMAEPGLTIDNDYERYRFYKSVSGLLEAHPFVVSVYIYYCDGEKVYYQTRKSSGIADRKSFPDNAAFEEFSPVLGILKRLGSTGEAVGADTGGNEFNRIHMHIDNIMQENKELEIKLEEYFSIYKGKVLRALLESNPPDSEGEEKLDFSSDYEWFQVFVVEMKGNNQEENTVAEIGRILSEYGRVEEISMDKNRLAVILCMKEKCGFTVLEESLKPIFISDIVKSLKLKIAAGDAVGSIRDIHISYREAVQSLSEIKRSTGGHFYGFNPKPATNRHHHGEAGINNRELIQKVILYIENHYMEDIGLETIAEHVFFSPSYLGKVFREVSGMTFTDYLIQVRMKTAVRLLMEGDRNISRIAEEVGYSSVQSFSKAFRNHYHCSPGEYRKKSFIPG